MSINSFGTHKVLLQGVVIVLVFFVLPAYAEAGVTNVYAGTLGAALTTTDATAALPSNTQASDILIIHAWTRSTAHTTVIVSESLPQSESEPSPPDIELEPTEPTP